MKVLLIFDKNLRNIVKNLPLRADNNYPDILTNVYIFIFDEFIT